MAKPPSLTARKVVRALKRATVRDANVSNRRIQLGSWGAHYRNDLPAVTAVDAEIGIRREYQWIGYRFRHAHQAGVSKAHTLAYFCKNATTGSTLSSKLNLTMTALRDSSAFSPGAPRSPSRW